MSPAPQDRHLFPRGPKGWRTSVSRISPGCVAIAGHPLGTLVGTRNLLEVTHLLLTGEFPPPGEHRRLLSIVREGAALPVPFPIENRAEDVCRTTARTLLADEPLPSDSGKENQPDVYKTLFCLGRTIRVLSRLMHTERFCAQPHGDEPLSSLLHRVLTGSDRLSERRAGMLEALSVACVDHGVTPPCTQATILAASVRAPYQTALAAGLSLITDVHGGAGERTAELLLACVARASASGSDLSATLRQVIAESLRRGSRIPGLGHRFHPEDPRCRPLVELAEAAGVAAAGLRSFQEAPHIYRSLRGSTLPLNVDGVIGAIVADMGLPPPVAKMVFVLGRVAGLSAHYFEELSLYPPMRWVDFGRALYDGSARRSRSD